LARTETFHFAVRVNCRAAARLRRTLHLPQIVQGAKARTAPDNAISVPDRAASLFGTQYLAILIRRALALSAHDVSILVLDAISGINLRGKRQGQEATNNESILHVVSPLSTSPARQYSGIKTTKCVRG
jgi:hypothetical protein